MYVSVGRRSWGQNGEAWWAHSAAAPQTVSWGRVKMKSFLVTFVVLFLLLFILMLVCGGK